MNVFRLSLNKPKNCDIMSQAENLIDKSGHVCYAKNDKKMSGSLYDLATFLKVPGKEFFDVDQKNSEHLYLLRGRLSDYVHG
jgi:hypothetical protein